jgi:predicted metalloprotease
MRVLAGIPTVVDLKDAGEGGRKRMEGCWQRNRREIPTVPFRMKMMGNAITRKIHEG